MDVIKAVQNYVNKMIDEVGGMKVLLLDTETASVKHVRATVCVLQAKFSSTLIDAYSVTRCNPIQSPRKRMLPD
jgi:ribonuclease D